MVPWHGWSRRSGSVFFRVRFASGWTSCAADEAGYGPRRQEDGHDDDGGASKRSQFLVSPHQTYFDCVNSWECLSWVMGFFHWFLLRSVLVHDKKMRMSKDKVQLQSIVEEVITLARQSSGEVGSHSLSPGAILKVWRICFVGEKSVLRWMDGFTETGCFVCVFKLCLYWKLQLEKLVTY